MRRISCGCLVAWLAVAAGAYEVVYVGIEPGGAPSFEQGFDRQVREALSAAPGLELADDETTNLINRKVRFMEFPALARTLVQRLTGVVSDSTVVVWASVRDYSVSVKREWLVRAVTEGSVTVSLNMYSLRFKHYAYSGDVVCQASQFREWVLFSSVAKSQHLSASERTAITSQLQLKASQRAAAMICAVVGTESKKAEYLDAGARKYEEPSVSELFRIPSVSAPLVDTGSTKPAAAPDSLSKPTPASDSAAPQKQP